MALNLVIADDGDSLKQDPKQLLDEDESSMDARKRRWDVDGESELEDVRWPLGHDMDDESMMEPSVRSRRRCISRCRRWTLGPRRRRCIRRCRRLHDIEDEEEPDEESEMDFRRCDRMADLMMEPSRRSHRKCVECCKKWAGPFRRRCFDWCWDHHDVNEDDAELDGRRWRRNDREEDSMIESSTGSLRRCIRRCEKRVLVNRAPCIRWCWRRIHADHEGETDE